MSIDTSKDEITIEGDVYEIEREENVSFPVGTKLYVIDPHTDERIDGLEGVLGYEEEASFANPRDWANVGMMVCDYNGYLLGDQDGPSLEELQGNHDTCPRCEGHNYVNPDDLTEAETADYANKGIVPDEDNEVVCPVCEGDGEIEIDMIDYIRREYKARVILPLYVYEHSGITMRSGSPVGPRLTRDDVRSTGRFMGDDAGWDTSTVGFTFDTPEKVKDSIGDNATDEQIQKALEQEVAIYASYLEGDVTYYSVEDDETGFSEGCGGYVGEHTHTESECFTALEEAIIKRRAEIVERNYWNEREVVTDG